MNDDNKTEKIINDLCEIQQNLDYRASHIKVAITILENEYAMLQQLSNRIINIRGNYSYLDKES